MGGGLTQAFLGALSEPARATFETAFADASDLERRLQTAFDEAVDPGPLDVEPDEFAAHVAQKVPDDAEADILDKLRTSDLYLALACSKGDQRALGRFETEYGRDIDLAIARSGNAGVSKDEFRQLVRNKLFVAKDGKRPKIGDYAGRGDLRSWVRVTALRMIVDIVRQRAGGREISVEAEMLVAVPSPQEDPELDYIQRVYRNEFKDALGDAFAALTPRERNLLRQQVLHGLNIDQIGALYRVHRTTAFRWLEKARKALLRETRGALKNRLRVGSGEFTSIMRVVQSELDVSVRRILAVDLEDEGSISQ